MDQQAYVDRGWTWDKVRTQNQVLGQAGQKPKIIGPDIPKVILRIEKSRRKFRVRFAVVDPKSYGKLWRNTATIVVFRRFSAED